MKLPHRQLYPLESWLQHFSRNQALFPDHDRDYFTKYSEIYNYLFENYLNNVNLASTFVDGVVYTDHGPQHILSVIERLGELFNINEALKNKERFNTINDFKGVPSPYETFLALISVLLHDAGMLYGRHEHEQKVMEISKKLDQALLKDGVEARIFATIAKAHGGKVSIDGKNSKDTIGAISLKEHSGNQPVRIKMLAAAIKLADELSENRYRANNKLMEEGIINEDSRIHHVYALCIHSSQIDHSSRSISFDFEISAENTEHVFKISEKNSIFLSDYIFDRMKKLFLEIKYCSRFSSGVFSFDKVRFQIVIEKNWDMLYSQNFVLEERGYPDSSTYSIQPDPLMDWVGEKLKDRVRVKLEATQ